MSRSHLPSFPEFKKLALTDKTVFTEYTKHYPPYSDFNFISTWSYDTNNDLLISDINENLVIRFRDYITNEPFYSFIGENDIQQTIVTLLEDAAKKSYLPLLKLIPESCIANNPFIKTLFEIKEDPNNFDYIVSTQELRFLSGSKFHTQKNHLNKFDTLYPHAVTRMLDIDKDTIQKEILDVFYRWEAGRQKKREETEQELKALLRLLFDHNSFGLISLGIYINGALIAFSITDIEHNSYAQIHFAKCDPLYKEGYYKLNNHLANLLHEIKHDYINLEQDLGIPGLRFSKQQWNPVHYLKKYTIEKKQLPT